MTLPRPRLINLLIFIATSGLMSVGFIMEHQMGLEPCPLCMTQRIFIVLTGFFGLLAFLHNPGLRGTQIYGTATLLSALTGGGFSIRQLYLQSLPEDLVPACGPSLSYILDTFPLAHALKLMLTGDGNCAEVAWTFMGISIPGWTLVAFAALAGISIWQIVRSSR
ncbi:MAG: disulfide bond formation protein B [Pseudomonadales bacterium]